MRKAKYVLALDQGTTSSRAIVFDEVAQMRSVAQRSTTQHFPHPGWVNQDALEIWSTTLATAKDAIQKAGLDGQSVTAIGIANQRETLVVWDRETGNPAAPAIVWQSRQSQPQIDALVARGMSRTYQKSTGLVPDAYFTASKLAWLLETNSELRRRAEAADLLAGTVDSWLLWQLTAGAVHATDVSNASRTMLFDIRTLDWSAALLGDLAIPHHMLPRVVASAGVAGLTSPEVLGAEIPVSGIAGDQQAALFGQTCFDAGEAKNTYGTGAFLLMNTGKEPKISAHKLLSTIAWQIDGSVDYALEGAVFICGAAVEWLRDGLGIIDAAADVEALATSVPDSGGVTVVPALTGLGAPHWDASARGTILGLTRGSTAGHIARATLEAIAFQTRDVTAAMSADSGIPLTSLRVDGGAARNDLLMQIQADILGVPVVRPANVETTAVGAAFLAGLGEGLWPSRTSVAGHWVVDRVFEPEINTEMREARYAVWRRAIDRSLNWAQ
ncbi:MAG: glycerol kinase GlpK [Chloroflexi bacterium]|nr:glycerol kinase GlpK [Chloroflexota bacterium]